MGKNQKFKEQAEQIRELIRPEIESMNSKLKARQLPHQVKEIHIIHPHQSQAPLIAKICVGNEQTGEQDC